MRARKRLRATSRQRAARPSARSLTSNRSFPMRAFETKPSATRPTRSRPTGRRCGCWRRSRAAASPISNCRPAPSRTPSPIARSRKSGSSSPGAGELWRAPGARERRRGRARRLRDHPARNPLPVPRRAERPARLRRRHHAALAGRGGGGRRSPGRGRRRSAKARLPARARAGSHRDESRERRAGLAQLVEQRFCKPLVVGSIPATGTTSPSQMFADVRKRLKKPSNCRA